MRDMVDVHADAVRRVGDSIDLWSITTAAAPVALIAIGQPTTDPFGFTIIAGHSSSLLTAAGQLATWMADRSWMDEFAPDWRGPIGISFAVQYCGDGVLDIVGWSYGGATSGQLRRPGHPEIPLIVHLVNMPKPQPSIFKSQLALHLLGALHDSTTICEGVW